MRIRDVSFIQRKERMHYFKCLGSVTKMDSVLSSMILKYIKKKEWENGQRGYAFIKNYENKA